MSSPGAPPPAPGVLATLREALRGGHGDFTEGPVGRAVVLLAIPMVLEMALESVFAVGGRLLGVASSARRPSPRSA